MSRLPYGEQSELRAAVAAMSSELARVPGLVVGEQGGGVRRNELLSRWKELLDVLALSPEPELRLCPACGESIMAAATRCRGCWRRVAPLPEKQA